MRYFIMVAVLTCALAAGVGANLSQGTRQSLTQFGFDSSCMGCEIVKVKE